MVSSDVQIPALDDLAFIPYLDEQGQLPSQCAGKVGLYAIFDEGKSLQFVGYSRDILLSLKQHLVRRPNECIWVKINTIERPSRTVLEQIKHHWLEAQGSIPIGNGEQEAQWTQPIDAKTLMNEAEQGAIANVVTESERSKLLKKIARRVESDILATLDARGVRIPIRFDPKMKEQGLLNLKPE